MHVDIGPSGVVEGVSQRECFFNLPQVELVGCSSAGSGHMPAFPVKSIDSTGAGDAFIGSFAVFLGEGLPEREAVLRANLYAGLSTTGVGTQKSFYDRARYDAQWAMRSKSQ